MIREKTARGLWKSYRVVERSGAGDLAAAPSAENVSSLELGNTTVIASVCDIGDDNSSQGESESEYITLVISDDVERQRLSENGGETTQSQGHATAVSEHHPTSTDMAVTVELCKGHVTDTGVNVNTSEQSATFQKIVTDKTESKATKEDGKNSGQTNYRQMNFLEVSLSQGDSSNTPAFGKTPQANTTIGGDNNGGQTCSTKGEHESDTPVALTHASNRGQSAGESPAAERGKYRGHQTVRAVLKNELRSTPTCTSVADSMYEGHVPETGIIDANTDKQNGTIDENEVDNNIFLQDGMNTDQTCSTPEVSLPKGEPSSTQASGTTQQANATTGEDETMCSADSSPMFNTPVVSVTTDTPDMGQSVGETPVNTSGRTGVSMPLGSENQVAEISYCSSEQTAGSCLQPITSTISKNLFPSRKRRRKRLSSIPEEVTDISDTNNEDLGTEKHQEVVSITTGKETTAEDVAESREDDTIHTAKVTTTEKGVVKISSSLGNGLKGTGQGEISEDIAEGLSVYVQSATDSCKTDQTVLSEPLRSNSSTSKANPSCVEVMESKDDAEHTDKKTMATMTEKAQDTKEAIPYDMAEGLHYNGQGATDTVKTDEVVLSECESLGLTPPLSTAMENAGHVQTTFTQQDKTMSPPEAGNVLLNGVAGAYPLCNDTEGSPEQGTNKSEAKPYVKPDLSAGHPDHVKTTLARKNQLLEEELSNPNEIQDCVTFAEGKNGDNSAKSASGKMLSNNHLILHESLNTCSKEELIAKIAELTQENITLKATQQTSSKADDRMVAFKSEGGNQEGENNMETNPLSPEPYRVKLKEMTREVSELLQDQAELNEEVDTLRQCQEKVDFLILENKSLLFEENGWLADEEDIGSQADTDFEEDSVLQNLREELAITQEQLNEKDKKLQEAEENVAQLTEELDRLKSGRKAVKKPTTKTEKRRRSTTSQEVSLLESHMVFSTKVETILGEVREHVQKLEVENAKLKDEKKELELKLTKEKS